MNKRLNRKKMVKQKNWLNRKSVKWKTWLNRKIG